jgi:hypothetical protein
MMGETKAVGGGRRGTIAGALRAHPLMLAIAPVIYALIVPLAALDLCVSIYQLACFPAYGIAPVARSRYFAFDRARLPFLNALERLNCLYCSYANGVIAYAREIAARTEQYWCPIKHAVPPQGTHDRYTAFEAYGDDASYDRRLAELRAALRTEGEMGAPEGAAAPRVEAP